MWVSYPTERDLDSAATLSRKGNLPHLSGAATPLTHQKRVIWLRDTLSYRHRSVKKIKSIQNINLLENKPLHQVKATYGYLVRQCTFYQWVMY